MARLPRDHAAQARVFQRRRGAVAGQQVVAAGVVVAQFVRQRADQGDVPHHLGRPGQVLADADARDGGVDRLEVAPHFDRRIGLGVERVEVARPAVEPDEDAGDVLADLLVVGDAGGGLCRPAA